MNISKLWIPSLLLSLLVSLPAAAQEGAVLPFQYSEGLVPPFQQGQSRVLPGVMASISSHADFKLTPTQTLFLVPSRAKVSLGEIVESPGASCQAFQKDRQLEDDLAAVVLSATQRLRQENAFADDMATKVDEAKKACFEATLKRAPEKQELCDTAKELRGLQKVFADDELLPELEKLNKVRDMIAKRIEVYGTSYGGYAGAIVNLFDAAEVDEVQTLNPGYSVRLVNIKDVVFGFNASVEADAEKGLAVPRSTALGFTLQGESTTTAPSGGSVAAVTKLKSGQSTSLGIKLSVIGACAYKDLRTASFNYSYDTYGYVRGVVTYNRWSYYSKLEEHKTERGFFTTKDSHEVSEQSKSEDTLKISAFGNDEQSKDEMRDRLQKLTEEKLLGMMAQKATLAVDTPELHAPASGASTSGKILTEKCPNLYCQIAGYSLLALDSIFGGGTTRAKAEAMWNNEQTIEWNETTTYVATDGASQAKIEFKKL